MRIGLIALSAVAAGLLATAGIDAFAKEKGKPKAEAAIDLSAAPAGVYKPDPNHRAILFSYDHQGYSKTFVRWREWSGEINWNPAEPEKSTVNVTIDVNKVDSGVDLFDEHLKGDKLFDAAKHPKITFKSTSLKRRTANAGTMTGDLTIKGVTKPVTLDVTLNKAAFEQRGNLNKLGFSAKGVVKRTDFGMDYAVPFVGDEVTIVIEAEFQAPAV
jgi:polyisoprenoid-binding protein YceI